MTEAEEILLIDELELLANNQKEIVNEYKSQIPDEAQYREWQKAYFLTDDGKEMIARMKAAALAIRENRAQQQSIRLQIMRTHIEQALSNQ